MVVRAQCASAASRGSSRRSRERRRYDRAAAAAAETSRGDGRTTDNCNASRYSPQQAPARCGWTQENRGAREAVSGEAAHRPRSTVVASRSPATMEDDGDVEITGGSGVNVSAPRPPPPSPPRPARRFRRAPRTTTPARPQALRDMPHPRHDCVVHKWPQGPPAQNKDACKQFCAKCFCCAHAPALAAPCHPPRDRAGCVARPQSCATSRRAGASTGTSTASPTALSSG